jgi:two-component system, NarL family, nitrate/nitrite response regulator NarL
MGTTMKVLVVAQIRLYRDGVADALRRLEDVESVATAASAIAATVAARQTRCDVVLLDMTMPESTEAVSALLTARADLKVVALGVPEDGPEVVACAQAGVVGYISRDASLVEVGDALRATIRGEAALSGKMAAGLLKHIAFHARTDRVATLPHQLTSREQQVLRLLQNGMTNRQIAVALSLQLSTVKNHVHSVLTKFGATRRSDVCTASAVRY